MLKFAVPLPQDELQKLVSLEHARVDARKPDAGANSSAKKSSTVKDGNNDGKSATGASSSAKKAPAVKDGNKKLPAAKDGKKDAAKM